MTAKKTAAQLDAEIRDVVGPFHDEEGVELGERDLDEAARFDMKRFGLSRDEANALVRRNTVDYLALLADVERWRQAHGYPAANSPLTRGFVLSLIGKQRK